MKTDSIVDRVKKTLKKGIGLAGKRFSIVSEQQFGNASGLFAACDEEQCLTRPEQDRFGLHTLRIFRTFEQLLRDRWDDRAFRGYIYATEIEVLLKPPADCEPNPDAFWKVLDLNSCSFLSRITAAFYPVDDRPAISPAHLVRVFHVTVYDGSCLNLGGRFGDVSAGFWEVTVELQKRPQSRESGCNVVAVRELERSGLVETQRALAGLKSSLEGRPPSLRWE